MVMDVYVVVVPMVIPLVVVPITSPITSPVIVPIVIVPIVIPAGAIDVDVVPVVVVNVDVVADVIVIATTNDRAVKATVSAKPRPIWAAETGAIIGASRQGYWSVGNVGSIVDIRSIIDIRSIVDVGPIINVGSIVDIGPIRICWAIRAIGQWAIIDRWIDIGAVSGFRRGTLIRQGGPGYRWPRDRRIDIRAVDSTYAIIAITTRTGRRLQRACRTG